MLQTTIVVDPVSVRADAAINAEGGGARIAGGELALNIDVFRYAPDWAGYANLDWTRVGYWSTGSVWDYLEGGDARHRGVFVVGYETPTSAMPSSGTASFVGNVNGSWFVPTSGPGPVLACNCVEVYLTGSAAFTADFGARTVNGSFSNMTSAGMSAWNDVGFASSISGNAFSGTSWAINTPAGAMSPDAAGTIRGRFFGPAAQEAGAVWTLYDGNSAAIGTITGRRQ